MQGGTKKITTLLSERSELNWSSLFLADFPQAELFLVGGAVRDTLLGRATKDFDFVIRNLKKHQIEEWFSERGQLNFVGRTFGVYKFMPKGMDCEPIDLALPRTEAAFANNHGGYREFEIDARMDLPIEIDLGRRDFTINALAYNVRSKNIIDPYNGQMDISSRTIRAVGSPPRRLKEDLSRLLRAIRFSCELGFHIDDKTWLAIKELAPSINKTYVGADGMHASELAEGPAPSGFWVVPRETVGREFLKSFTADPFCTLTKYEESGVAKELFESVDLDLAKERIQDAAGMSPRLLLALLLSATDPSQARKIAENLHFNQFPRKHRLHINTVDVLWMLRSLRALDIIENPFAMKGSMFEKLFLSSRGNDLLDLMTLTKSAKDNKLRAVRERIADIHSRLGDEIPELISGDDLIGLGYKPGPKFRELMTRVRDAQIAGEIETKEEAIEFILPK